MVADTNALLERKASENPSVKDKSPAVVLTYGTQVGVYKTQDVRSEILYQLGLNRAPSSKA